MTFERCSVGAARYAVGGARQLHERDADALRAAVHRRARGGAPSREETLVSMMALSHTVCYFMYRYILRESCSHFDSLPLTYLTILHDR